jgi:hypothetical protein
MQSAEARPWRNSEAQKLLQKLLVSGEIPISSTTSRMAPVEIWNNVCLPRQEFAGFLFEKFPQRLRAMRKRLLEKGGRSEQEYVAFLHDKQHFPTPSHNHRGEPRWHGSDAERLLKLDVTAKKHELMAPQQLHGTRKEYQDYALVVFRKHIHQEVRLQKLVFQYDSKNKIKK